jgi:Zn-dependent peptidase ImmA (M78 family)
MTKQWLHPNQIEQEANKLIYEFNKSCMKPISEPPIPIDLIIESYLGLQIDIDSPTSYNLSENTLGALYIEDKRVFINQDIAKQEGRYNFTLAHEVAHWQLHRNEIPEIQYVLPLNQETNTSFNQIFKRGHVVICRDGDKNPIEWQADKFAAFILMPRDFFVSICNDIFEQIKTENKWSSLSPSEENVIINILAEKFKTSRIATRIRLQDIGFLGKNENQLGLF